MAAIANATGLTPPPDGLRFPPCSREHLAHVLRPVEVGGQLHHKGQVEVVSSLERDGRPVPYDLRWGVYVVVEAPNEYAAACFRQYGMNTDDTGRYSAMYKPFHLIGLELNVSVLSAGLLGRPTGAARDFVGDVAATAKRDLAAGETLDGEGGFTVYGTLLPARVSLDRRALPDRPRPRRDPEAGRRGGRGHRVGRRGDRYGHDGRRGAAGDGGSLRRSAERHVAHACIAVGPSPVRIRPRFCCRPRASRRHFTHGGSRIPAPVTPGDDAGYRSAVRRPPLTPSPRT
jgi:hypothetical protein